MSANDQKPIIIKRRASGGEEAHHGGAWKVAYADFVTAMMAFFMLMWLLNATTEKQRKGLADYFSPTVAMTRSSGGGDGALGGRSLASDAALVQLGRGGVTSSEAHGTAAEEGRMEAVESAVLGKGGDSLLDREELRHVSVRLTDEGLVIELFDLPDRPLFEDATPTETLTGLLSDIVPLLREETNLIALNVFTAAEPIVTRIPRVWDLSTARAQALRTALPAAGLPERRIARLTGHADRRPAVADPLSVRNNRVEVVLLRSGILP